MNVVQMTEPRAAHPITSWRTRTVIRVLLIVAWLIAEDDDETRAHVTTLANHIQVGGL